MPECKAFNYCHLGSCARLPSRAFSYFSEDTAPGLDAPKMPIVRLYLKRALPACWEVGEKVSANPCVLLLHRHGNHIWAVAVLAAPWGTRLAAAPVCGSHHIQTLRTALLCLFAASPPVY